MASDLSALTPEGTPKPQAKATATRSATMPARLSSGTTMGAAPSAGSTPSVDVLFHTGNSKIIKFSAAPSKTEKDSRKMDQVSGLLPWATPNERIMTEGPLEVYRVPGSVSFLRSGHIIHAMLARGQCWCVDGVSKFVVPRQTKDTYYRIELPGRTAEDLETVETFKKVLANMLRYERTECPFSRTFTVDLPETHTKTRKSRRKDLEPAKKWKLQRANKWSREGEEDVERSETRDSSVSAEHSDMEDYTTSSGPEDVDEGEDAQSSDETHGVVHDSAFNTPSKPDRDSATQVDLASPQSTLISTPTSRLRPDVFPSPSVQVAQSPVSVPNPLDPARLRTFQAIPTDMPPSPPDSSGGIEWVETGRQSDAILVASPTIDNALETFAQTAMVPSKDDREESGITRTSVKPTMQPDKPSTSEDGEASKPVDTADFPSTPKKDTITSSEHERLDSRSASSERMYHGSPEVEDQFAQIQARILARRCIGGTTPTSQLPYRPRHTSSSSSANTLSSNQSSVSRRSHRNMTAHQQAFGTALAKKAAHVFLGPPAYLVAIMLQIAKRFAEGALNVATTFVLREPRLKMPGSFHPVSAHSEDETSSGDEVDMDAVVEGDDVDTDGDENVDEWDEEGEDDFGVSLQSPIRAAVATATADRGNLRPRKTREAFDDG